MTKFLYHEPCPQCGSKNNLGVWDDGHKWCFGCKYYEYGTKTAHHVHKPQISATYNPKIFPEDASDYIPSEPLRWLFSCGLTYDLIEEHKIKWSPSQQLVCWRIFGISGKELGWQGRCFKKDAKTKYIGHGKIHSEPCILGGTFPLSFLAENPKYTVVLCEDILSAIRVSAYLPAMPLFGCAISKELLVELKKRFTNIIVWLDADKLDNARKVGLNASLIGLSSQVLYTPKDPKNYTNEEIKNYLETLE